MDDSSSRPLRRRKCDLILVWHYLCSRHYRPHLPRHIHLHRDLSRFPEAREVSLRSQQNQSNNRRRGHLPKHMRFLLQMDLVIRYGIFIPHPLSVIINIQHAYSVHRLFSSLHPKRIPPHLRHKRRRSLLRGCPRPTGSSLSLLHLKCKLDNQHANAKLDWTISTSLLCLERVTSVKSCSQKRRRRAVYLPSRYSRRSSLSIMMKWRGEFTLSPSAWPSFKKLFAVHDPRNVYS